MINSEIGERIKILRKGKKFTREMLAGEIGISPKFLYEIEAGKKGFSATTLCQLASSLSVSCDYIMFGKDIADSNIVRISNFLNKYDRNEISKLCESLETINYLLSIINTNRSQ